MVEFFGYDAPPGAVEASSTVMANNGAPKLASFLNGIDAAREHGAGDAHITVAGHSYGSTTAGIAATLVNDGVIDDIVQFGSPGSGVQDVDKVRSILNDSLTPLGLTMWEKEDNGDRGRTTTMVWYHEKYGATVSVLIAADDGYSETHYGAEPLRSDGSTEDPERFLFQTGRMPAGFDSRVIPKK